MRTSCRARCTTIKFATDPSSVRFPARVDDIARVSQPRCGSDSLGTTGRKTSTAGTLLTMLDSSAEKALNTRRDPAGIALRKPADPAQGMFFPPRLQQ